MINYLKLTRDNQGDYRHCKRDDNLHDDDFFIGFDGPSDRCRIESEQGDGEQGLKGTHFFIVFWKKREQKNLKISKMKQETFLKTPEKYSETFRKVQEKNRETFTKIS